MVLKKLWYKIINRITITRKFADREKIKVIEVTERSNVSLVIINLYMKFIVHFSNVKEVIVLEVADRRTDGRAA